MNALRQYIDLYKGHKELFDSNSAAPLNALRPEACRVLESASLPKPGSANYENTDFEKMLAPDFGINVTGLEMDVNPAATFRCDVPALSRYPFLLVNDTFASTCPDEGWIPEGVEVCSLRDFAEREPELVARYYGKAADMSNPMVALDSMLVRDGFFLRVKKGVRLEQPLQLVNILQNGAPLMAVRRLLIVIEDDAEAKLLVCDHTQNPDIDFLSLETVEIFVGENASFDYYSLEESSERTGRISTLWLEQQKGSHAVVNGITLFNGTTRNEYYCRFRGEDASLRLLGMGIEDAERHISTFTRIDHNVPRCHSDELFRYTVDDHAHAAFIGRIYVAEGAVKTEAYQSNRNLVGSDTARMTSKPELEIYNDDVKCSHGTAIGQLDPMQLFYMRTRGIDEPVARLLLKQAFMSDIIDGVRVDALRERLHILTERRFAGAESACASCRGFCGIPDQNASGNE